MEAAVTFVGFAASLVTLIAVVGDSAQTIHSLWTNFRDSPTNLKRLSHAIAENEALLKNMHAVSDAYERVGIPESLLIRWASTYKNVCKDFEGLNMEMSKIVKCTQGSQITRGHLRMRIRHFFSEKVLETRCQQLSAHKADMSYIHLLMHRSVRHYDCECNVDFFDTALTPYRLERNSIPLNICLAQRSRSIFPSLAKFKIRYKPLGLKWYRLFNQSWVNSEIPELSHKPSTWSQTILLLVQGILLFK